MIEQTDLRVDGKVALPQTPSQTVGPFFAYALTPEQYGYEFNDLINNQIINSDKNAIKIIGQVFDGEGNAIPDAMIELYSPEIAMNTCARCGTGTDLEGKFSFSYE